VVGVAIRPEKVKLSRRGSGPGTRSFACDQPARGRRHRWSSYLGGLTVYKGQLDFGRGGAARRWPNTRAGLDIDAYIAGQRGGGRGSRPTIAWCWEQ